MNLGTLGNRQWQLALGTLFAATLLYLFGHGTPSQQGNTVSYTITVVPSDARNLNCALDTAIGNQRCSFDFSLKNQNIEQPLRPYVTTNRELLLLKGVFESPNVAAWLNASQQRSDDRRVSLDCQARTLGAVPKVLVRWSNDGAFQPEENVMAAEITNCVVQK